MARKKKLSLAGAMAMANKGKAKFVKGKKVKGYSPKGMNPVNIKKYKHK